MSKAIVLISLIVLCPQIGLSETRFTAVCTEPNGFSFNKFNGSLTISEKDRLAGIHPSYFWTATGKTVQITYNEDSPETNPMGPGLLTAIAPIILINDEIITFIEQRPIGTDMHSIYLSAGDLFISTHKDWSIGGKGKLSARTFHAKCKINKTTTKEDPRHSEK